MKYSILFLLLPIFSTAQRSACETYVKFPVSLETHFPNGLIQGSIKAGVYQNGSWHGLDAYIGYRSGFQQYSAGKETKRAPLDAPFLEAGYHALIKGRWHFHAYGGYDTKAYLGTDITLQCGDYLRIGPSFRAGAFGISLTFLPVIK